MNSQTTTQTAADEDAIRAIHQRMIDAWNAGDGAAFAAPFTDEADFVAWEGTHLKGRQQSASFTQRIFDTVVPGLAPGRRGDVRAPPEPRVGRDALRRQDGVPRADRDVTIARFHGTDSGDKA